MNRGPKCSLLHVARNKEVGHVLRVDDGRLPKQVTLWEVKAEKIERELD